MLTLNFLIWKFILFLVRELFSLCLTRFYNMVKRKPSVGSDLRTNSIGMSVAKYDMTSLRNTSALHWKIGNIQPFFPPIEKVVQDRTFG